MAIVGDTILGRDERTHWSVVGVCSQVNLHMDFI